MNKKAILLLFIANAISGIAQGISMIAIPWYFAQNDQLAFFGMVYFLATFISIFWVPISGTFVDKYDRKKLFMVLTVVGGLIMTIISAYGYYRGVLPGHLVGLVFLTTFLNYNIHYPCLYAFVQEITERHNYASMTSALEIIGQFATILSGAIATLLLEGTVNGEYKIFGFPIRLGVDIEAWSIHKIFFVDAITYFFAFMIISFIRYTPIQERPQEIGSIASRLRTGWNYLKNDIPTLWYGILSYIVFLAVLLEAFYLGVSYVNNHLAQSGDVYANSKIAYAMGAIAIGAVISQLFKRYSIPAITIFFTLVTAILFIVLFSTNNIYVFFIMLFVQGIVNAGTRISRITYLFKNIPNQFFGRAGSVFFMSNILLRLILIFVFSFAFFQSANHIIYAYLIIGIILIVATILLVLKYKTFDNSISSV